eukprot:11157623-Heterocapsa_arctica.AAC.1
MIKSSLVSKSLHLHASTADFVLNDYKPVNVVHLGGKKAVYEARRPNQQFSRTGVSDLGVIAREDRYLGPVIHHLE